MRSGTGNTYKGSFVVALVGNKLIRGRPKTSQIPSKTKGKKRPLCGKDLVGATRAARMFFFMGMYLAIRVTKWTSDHRTTSCDRSHNSFETVPPFEEGIQRHNHHLHFQYVEVQFLLPRPNLCCRQIREMHAPASRRSISVQKKRRRKHPEKSYGWPSLLLKLPRKASMHSWVRGNGNAGLSPAGNQRVANCHCRGHIRVRPLGTKHSWDTMWLSSYCHILTGRDRRRKKWSERSWNLTIPESVGKTPIR